MHAGLNKGEARNALARAVFIHRLGEIRDRSFEQQRYRASGLNLVTAAIVLWNTVYPERATKPLREKGKLPDDGMLQFLSPLDRERINLTGDYVWRQQRKTEGGFREPGKRQAQGIIWKPGLRVIATGRTDRLRGGTSGQSP